MAGAFFSPVPFRVWAAKKYLLKPCKYRRNEVPSMESIGKKKNMGGIPMDSYYKNGTNERSPFGV